MTGRYRRYEPDQVMLLPAAPRYEGGGSRNQPFHSATMVKVLVYAYATGVFSSRKIERRPHEDLAFRMLTVDNFRATARSATSGRPI